jgi:hypothetical protein
VADLDLLVQTSDLSESDLTNPTRFSSALAELLPDMIRHYAARLEDLKPEPRNDYEFTLPGFRTRLGEATLADLELAQRHQQNQARESVTFCSWFELIKQALKALPPGKTVQEALTLEQLRVMRNQARTLVRRI